MLYLLLPDFLTMRFILGILLCVLFSYNLSAQKKYLLDWTPMAAHKEELQNGCDKKEGLNYAVLYWKVSGDKSKKIKPRFAYFFDNYRTADSTETKPEKRGTFALFSSQNWFYDVADYIYSPLDGPLDEDMNKPDLFCLNGLLTQTLFYVENPLVWFEFCNERNKEKGFGKRSRFELFFDDANYKLNEENELVFLQDFTRQEWFYDEEGRVIRFMIWDSSVRTYPYVDNDGFTRRTRGLIPTEYIIQYEEGRIKSIKKLKFIYEVNDLGDESWVLLDTLLPEELEGLHFKYGKAFKAYIAKEENKGVLYADFLNDKAGDKLNVSILDKSAYYFEYEGGQIKTIRNKEETYFSLTKNIRDQYASLDTLWKARKSNYEIHFLDANRDHLHFRWHTTNDSTKLPEVYEFHHFRNPNPEKFPSRLNIDDSNFRTRRKELDKGVARKLQRYNRRKTLPYLKKMSKPTK